MVHDVFISYSNEDKIIANAICNNLENNDINCWIAPRDVLPGKNYGESIVRAIGKAKILVLIFSSNSNQSSMVMRELERAVNSDTTIIPFRVEDVDPSESIKYFIAGAQWLDALTQPLEEHVDVLTQTVSKLLNYSEISNTQNYNLRKSSESRISSPNEDDDLCNNCGNKLMSGDLFCSECGTKREKIVAEKVIQDQQVSEEPPLVFISHISKDGSRDKKVANNVCRILEANGIKCWIAPRDILPTEEWDDAIVDAIEKCKIMLVIFSESVNESNWVKEEIHMAYDDKKNILTFRIEDAFPKKGLKLRLNRKQWFDAVTEPMDLHVQKLVKVVNGIIEMRNVNTRTKDLDMSFKSSKIEGDLLNSPIYKKPQTSKSKNDEICLIENVTFRHRFYNITGKLMLTNQMINFKPDLINIKRDKAEIPMGDVVEVKKWKLLGVSNGIRINTKDGKEYKFAIAFWEDKEKLINLIEEYAKISK